MTTSPPTPSRTATDDSLLRVALVTETWRPEVNGVARTLGRLVDGLRGQGIAVGLIRPRQHAADRGGKNEHCVPGLPIPRYPDLRFGLAFSGRLRREWQRQRPDIVHIATEGPLGMAALSAARKLDLPVSTSFHTNFDAYSRHYGFGWLRGAIAAHLRRFHNRADLTLVPTQELARRLTADGYRRIEVLSRGIDTALFHPGRRSPQLRRAWGADDDTLVVAYVGRLAPEKNLDMVLAAYAAICRHRTGVRLLFVGDGPARRSLQQRFPQHIYAGWRSGTDLAEHYASADLFLFPSLTETYGNVTLEALSSGLPVVAYACAAAAELVHDTGHGRLVPPTDAADYAEAAAAYAAFLRPNDALRQRIAASVAELGWERIHTQFARLLFANVHRHLRRRTFVDGIVAASD